MSDTLALDREPPAPEPLPVQNTAPVLSARGLAKTYRVYARPVDRLQQALFGSAASRYYTEFKALDGVSFDIRQGEAVAFIGRNGAGKSTLLQIISGVIPPSAGEVEVRGKIAPLLELGTSFNPEFTGLENIGLAGSILGLSGREIEERRDAIIAFADIGEHIAQPVRTYSSGMYARLAFAVAAHVDADILIVDEVLAVGDIRFTQKCMRFIREFRERGTLLFVSHDIGSVLAICDRAIWIDRGRVVEDGEPSRIVPHYQTFMASSDESLDAATFLRQMREAEAEREAVLARSRAAAALPEAAVQAPAPLPSPSGEPDPSLPARPSGVVVEPASTVEFSGFDWSARSHGERHGVILDAYWGNEDGGRITTLRGGDVVSLVMVFEAKQDLASPIIGFGVQNRHGQTVFAWDTSKKPGLLGRHLAAGSRAAARFTFRFPYLLGASYTLILALADGTPSYNTQEHWIFDALTFDVTWSTVSQGLMGIPIEVTFEPAP
jgi:lipopolysaccharide transport system ATP-binding protein